MVWKVAQCIVELKLKWKFELLLLVQFNISMNTTNANESIKLEKWLIYQAQSYIRWIRLWGKKVKKQEDHKYHDTITLSSHTYGSISLTRYRMLTPFLLNHFYSISSLKTLNTFNDTNEYQQSESQALSTHQKVANQCRPCNLIGQRIAHSPTKQKLELEYTL